MVFFTTIECEEVMEENTVSTQLTQGCKYLQYSLRRILISTNFPHLEALYIY